MQRGEMRTLPCLPEPLWPPLSSAKARGLEGFRLCIWEERSRKAALSKVHTRPAHLCPIMTERVSVLGLGIAMLKQGFSDHQERQHVGSC